MNEEQFKEKFQTMLKSEFDYLAQHKNASSFSNSQTLTLKTDNSENEINGNRFYFETENYIKRFIFTNDYKKEVDGFYTKHKDINLGIEGNVEININQLENSLNNNYNINNDLNRHIIFKNFQDKKIPKDEPLIFEVKKSFKLYDLIIKLNKYQKLLIIYFYQMA